VDKESSSDRIRRMDSRIKSFVREDGQLGEVGWEFLDVEVKPYALAVLRRAFPTSSPTDGLDAWQDAMTELLAKTNWNRVESPVGLAVVSSKRRLIDRMRDAIRRERSEVSETVDPFAVWTDDDRFRVLNAIDRLGNPERVVLALRFHLGWTLREISDALNMPRSTVYSVSVKGIEAIRKSLSR